MNFSQLETKARFLSFGLVQNNGKIVVTVPRSKFNDETTKSFASNDFELNITDAHQFMCLCEETFQLRSEIKKKEIEEFVRGKLASDDLWAKKALLLLFNHQTVAEQDAGVTIVHNEVGFSGCDGEYLSSLSEQLLRNMHNVKKFAPNISENEQIKRAWMSPKQLVSLKKIVKKYWRQVADASDQLKLLRAVKSARNAQQLSLTL